MIPKWRDYMERLIDDWLTYQMTGPDDEICPMTVEIFYEEDLKHICGECGAELEIVRPGKYQCPNCG